MTSVTRLARITVEQFLPTFSLYRIPRAIRAICGYVRNSGLNAIRQGKQNGERRTKSGTGADAKNIGTHHRITKHPLISCARHGQSPASGYSTDKTGQANIDKNNWKILITALNGRDPRQEIRKRHGIPPRAYRKEGEHCKNEQANHNQRETFHGVIETSVITLIIYR